MCSRIGYAAIATMIVSLWFASASTWTPVAIHAQSTTQAPIEPPAQVSSGAEVVRKVPEEIRSRLNVWWYSYAFWATVYYATGILSVILSTLVALMKSDESHAGRKRWMAGTAAVLTALLAFLKPLELRKAYHQAWQLLDAQVREYEHEPDVTIKSVNDAVKQGEALLKEQ